MSQEGITDCPGCGKLVMIDALEPCAVCKILKETERGISHAETDQRRDTMLGVRETEKGED